MLFPWKTIDFLDRPVRFGRVNPHEFQQKSHENRCWSVYCFEPWIMNHPVCHFFLLVNSPLFLWKFSYFGGQSHNTRVIFAADVSAFLFSKPWNHPPVLTTAAGPTASALRVFTSCNCSGTTPAMRRKPCAGTTAWTIPWKWATWQDLNLHFKGYCEFGATKLIHLPLCQVGTTTCSCRTTLGVLDAASLAFTCLASGKRFQRALFWA